MPSSKICDLEDLTLWNEFLQSAKKIRRSYVANGLEAIVVGNVNMWAEVMGGESQTDNQALVTKNLLLVSKNRVGKLGVES